MPPPTPPPYDIPQPPAESVLRFHLEGRGVLDVLPDPSATESAPLQPIWDLTGPFHVLTTWNPGGRPTTLEDNWAAHQQLLTAVPTGKAGASIDAAIYAPDLSWADRALAYTGLTDADVAAVARRFGQPYAWRWDDYGITVLDGDGQASAPTPAVTALRGEHPCPMRADQDATGFCTRPGGPWTSGSIAAAFEFERDREVKLTALAGCDTCSGGPVLGYPGTPVTCWVWTCASRYAPPQALGAKE